MKSFWWNMMAWEEASKYLNKPGLQNIFAYFQKLVSNFSNWVFSNDGSIDKQTCIKAFWYLFNVVPKTYLVNKWYEIVIDYRNRFIYYWIIFNLSSY